MTLHHEAGDCEKVNAKAAKMIAIFAVASRSSRVGASEGWVIVDSGAAVTVAAGPAPA